LDETRPPALPATRPPMSSANSLLRRFAGAIGVAAVCVSMNLRTPPRVEADEKPAKQPDPIDTRFATKVKPFLDAYCVSCHGPKKQSASLDLSRDTTVSAVVKNAKEWELALEKLHAKEMPPEAAKKQPTDAERAE